MRTASLNPREEVVTVDHNLLAQVEKVADGATIHELAQALTTYLGYVTLCNDLREEGESARQQRRRFREFVHQSELRLRRGLFNARCRSILPCGSRI